MIIVILLTKDKKLRMLDEQKLRLVPANYYKSIQ